MIDPDGVEWLRYSEASTSSGVPVATLKVWVHRRRVEVRRLGRSTWLHMGDVRRAEVGRARKAGAVV